VNNSGLLSIDFIAGFTIFMIAFIAVATLISGLLVGLQSKTIDYDAVAYRTGVILVEDPGAGMLPRADPYTTNWESVLDTNAPRDILRYGLAISKDYPNILSDRKIKQFFNNPSYSMNDYHTKAIFDLEPGSTAQPLFNFNIQITPFQDLPEYRLSLPRGEKPPENVNVGYIHRVIKIKQPTYATIDGNNRNSVSGLDNELIVYFDFPKLYEEIPPYRIDPINENIIMDIKNLDTSSPPLNPGWVAGTSPKLQEVRFYIVGASADTSIGGPIPISYEGNIKTPDLTDPTSWVTIGAGKDISLNLPPDHFAGQELDKNQQYYIKFTFEPGTTNLNDRHDYDYKNVQEVHIPPLISALMEIRIW
jgi:hypothetical protein